MLQIKRFEKNAKSQDCKDLISINCNTNYEDYEENNSEYTLVDDSRSICDKIKKYKRN